MRALLAFSRGVDRLNERVGGAVAWLTLAMILIGAYNAVVRYLGRYIGRDLSSNTYVELQWYLFSLVFLLGGAWTLKHGGHVRVDVVYGRLSARARAWIDVAGTVLFLLPFCALMLVLAWPYVANSIAVREGSPDPGGLARYPIKAAIPVAFALLFLQGVSELVKRLSVALGRARDSGEHGPEARI
jgi:TRAP-type mannitol/chloroaromatic compound transport system permease small subunit